MFLGKATSTILQQKRIPSNCSIPSRRKNHTASRFMLHHSDWGGRVGELSAVVVHALAAITKPYLAPVFTIKGLTGRIRVLQ